MATVVVAAGIAFAIPTFAGAGHEPGAVASYTGCLSPPAKGGGVYHVKLGDAPSAMCKSGHVQIHLSGGDITEVNATDGLTGSATSGGATISLAEGGVGISKIGTIPAARATTTSDQGIPDSVATTISLNSEAFDTAGLHDISTNNTRLTASVAGIYEIKGRVAWLGVAGGFRAIAINQSGVGTIAESREASAPGGDNVQNLSTLARLNAGDFVELHAYQTSGYASVSAVSGMGGSSAPELSMHWVAP